MNSAKSIGETVILKVFLQIRIIQASWILIVII